MTEEIKEEIKDINETAEAEEKAAADETVKAEADAAENEAEAETAEAEADGKCTKHRGRETKKLKAEIESLKKSLAEAEAKAKADEAAASDKYARLAAEYDNFRRRTAQEKASLYGEAVAATVMGIVPVIDNLMYAEQFGGGADNPEKFAEGVKLILGKLPETLEKMNVTIFGKAGETFDPNLHNAVMHVDDDSYGEGEITDVLQCGYKYGDRVIRYAMVKVAN